MTYILGWKSFGTRTYFLGLSVSVVLQFAEEGVLLGQQHFDVLHTHSDYPGANVRLKSVDTLQGQRRESCSQSQEQQNKSRFLTVTQRIKDEVIISISECELCCLPLLLLFICVHHICREYSDDGKNNCMFEELLLRWNVLDNQIISEVLRSYKYKLSSLCIYPWIASNGEVDLHTKRRLWE